MSSTSTDARPLAVERALRAAEPEGADALRHTLLGVEAALKDLVRAAGGDFDAVALRHVAATLRPLRSTARRQPESVRREFERLSSASRWTGLGARTIRRWVRTGKLPGYRANASRGPWLVRAEELDALLRAQRVPVRPEDRPPPPAPAADAGVEALVERRLAREAKRKLKR